MIISLLIAILLSSLVVVVLYGVTVIIAYCKYWKEKKDAARWATAIIARLGEIAERIDPIVIAWDDDERPSGKQREFLGKYADIAEEILVKVHEYLVAIEKPRMGCVAAKFKAEVEQRVRELEIFAGVLEERAKKTK